MTFRNTLFGAVLLAMVGACAANAQVGVYGTVNGQRIGGITCPANAAPCGNNNGEVKPFGGDFGAYYELRDLGPARLGVDVRGETLVANKRGDSSAGGGHIDRHYGLVGGLRASFDVPRYHAVHPYFEVLGGYDHNNDTGLYTSTTTAVTGTTSTTSLTFNPDVYHNYGVVKGLVGLDVRLTPNFDIRAVEFGVGEAFGSATRFQAVSVNSAGTSTTTSTASGPSTHGIQSVGAGIVIRFGTR